MENDHEALASKIAREGGKSCTDAMVEIARAIAIDGVKQAAEFLVQYIVSATTNTMLFIINDILTRNFPLHYLSYISVCTAKNDISGYANLKD